MSGPYAPVPDPEAVPASTQVPAPSSTPAPTPISVISEEDGWVVPQGLPSVAQAKPEPVDEDKPTTTDALQQDVAPPEYPAGSPKMRPYMRLPRRQRAQFFRELQPVQELMGQLPKQGQEVDGAKAAQMYDSLAQVEDFLRPLAEDHEEFDTWMAGPGADDATFVKFFSAYFAGAQLGEAASSSS